MKQIYGSTGTSVSGRTVVLFFSIFIMLYLCHLVVKVRPAYIKI